MKKLLNLLFLFFIIGVYGQTNLRLDQSYIETAPFKVGDTITIKFLTFDETSSVPTLIQFDYQYNVKLLDKIDHTFKLADNTSALTSLNHWDGYKWTPTNAIGAEQLTGQLYAGSYSVNADWAVERITVQNASAIAHEQTILEVRFKIKDKVNSDYTDYSAVSTLNWANVKDNSTDTTYDVWADEGGLNLDIGAIGGGVLSAVTLKVSTPVTTKSEFAFTIRNLDTDTDFLTGNLDSAGEVIVTTLTDGVNYQFTSHVPSADDVQPTWLDDIVTITDVYLIFNYIAATDIDLNGNGSFDYHLQKLFSDVTQTSAVIDASPTTWSSAVSDNDSYTFLAYLAGTLPTYEPQTGVNFYPITSTTYGSMNYSMLTSYYGKQTIDVNPSSFSPSPSETVFNFSHGFNGDVDLSHSDTPATSGYDTSAKSTQSSKVQNTSFQNPPENSNLDINTELINGKVVMEINTTKEGMAGTQFNLTYDTNMLEFSEIVFDTGNTMTNYANDRNGKLFIGSLDLSGGETVKVGTPYTVIFTPKQTITNTIGLVSFGVKEGVKTDGTKVNFYIN